jgi:hypothetical protein
VRFRVTPFDPRLPPIFPLKAAGGGRGRPVEGAGFPWLMEVLPASRVARTRPRLMGFNPGDDRFRAAGPGPLSGGRRA